MMVLGTLLGFASISTDVFLPALPTMQRSLGSSQNVLELVVTGYLVGFGLGQLFWGPLSDRFGRRVPIAAGLILFVVGCAGCAFSVTPWELIGFRVLQALGACASVVLGRAIVRDLYERDQPARMLSTLMTVMAIAPLVGPSVGSIILHLASWQAIFWALVLVGVVTLAALFTIPESLSSTRRNTEPLGVAFAAYGALIGDPRILAYGAAVGLFYAGIFASIAGSAFAYIDYYALALNSSASYSLAGLPA
jgi:DHA1 family bicyclomycin/chloramphenicol resistance-like MFS transporter